MGRHFVSKNRKSTKKKQNKKKNLASIVLLSFKGLVFLTFFFFCSFFSAFTKNFFFLLCFFFASFVNPKQWHPLVVHKLTSRTSVGVEDWSNSSRPFPLGPLCVCWCCCCCCLPSRRLLNNTRSICSWHSLRTSWTLGNSKKKRC